MVYLLCFDQHYKHARHYIGYTKNARTMAKRLAYHKAGQGSKLMRAVSMAGIEFKVVRLWHKADRLFERALHNQHNSKRLCPICNSREVL